MIFSVKAKRNFENPKDGSALVLTLLVVSLLVILSLAFVATVRMELRNVISYQQHRQVRAQARLAMSLAIGRLQETAGADKRVTGVSGLAGFTVAGQQGHWTGVWPSDSTAGPTWLVSGVGTPVPSMSLGASNSIPMVPADPATAGSVPVLAPYQSVAQPLEGRIAWWVGDEGVKARVDIVRAAEATPPERERKIRAQSPREPDLISLGGAWATEPNAALFARNATSGRNRLVSRGTVGLAVQDVPDTTLFHDVTVHGFGLPVNVKDGGLKADWSVILDRSRDGTPLVEHYMGARPTKSGVSGDHDADIWAFPEGQIYNPNRFFLSNRIGSQVSVTQQRPGPNWGILWHYGRLWREVQNNRTLMVGNHPRVQSDLRRENWLPYNSANRSSNNSDQQHTNSTVSPILSHLQLGLRLRSRPDGVNVDGITPMYAILLELKPMIGLWNPYNIGIAESSYLLDWLPSPMVKLRIRKPDGTEEVTTSWLRLIWAGEGSGQGVVSGSNSERWMQLQTLSNTDFQPGEVRMFSISTLVDQTRTTQMEKIILSPNWSNAGVILVSAMSGSTFATQVPIRVPAGSSITVEEVYLQDSHHPDAQAVFGFKPEHSLTWLTLKAKGGAIYMTRFTGFWNGGRADLSAQTGDTTIPARILPSAANKVSAPVENLIPGDAHMATWAFHLRTSTQMDIPGQRIRAWIDSDPRAVVGSPQWDGARENPGAAMQGWNFVSAYMGGLPYDNVPPSVTDGHPHLNRGLVSAGFGAQQAPQMDTTDPNRVRGYMGPSNAPLEGYTHLPLFDVPTAPLVSVGQFQHAQLGRYTFEPGFVAGNSYANVRIPLDRTVATNFNGISGFNLYDISYDVNQRIWDRVFFSTLAPDYVGGGTSWDTAFANRLQRLPNPRMVYVPNQGDPSLDALLASAGANGHRGAEALSSRIRILGAFNVNSTSKTAWKAVLSSMVTAELPVVNPATRALSWENPEGIRFNRFGHVLSSRPYLYGEGNHEGFWRGWREISALELDQLAEAIVEEVKARGPFRSMGEFVNRNPASSEINHRRKGALQAALDRTVNAQGTALPDDLGRKAQTPLGSHFSNAIDGESEAAGFPGYVLQGDILQSLAPILQARSDTFVIRAYGDVGTGAAPTARAWCEAVVQRSADYVEPSNASWHNPVDDTLHPLNAQFGRRFEIVSFRWLDAAEAEGL